MAPGISHQNEPSSTQTLSTVNEGENVEICQKTIDLFSDAFAETLSLGKQLELDIQQVKASLYDRNYADAFGSQTNLNAYVVRWSPSRAISYRYLFESLPEVKASLLGSDLSKRSKVLSIGGGAGSEVAALASIAFLSEGSPKLDVNVVDVADWSQALEKLRSQVALDWFKKPNDDSSLEDLFERLMLDDSPFRISFVQANILDLDLTSSFSDFKDLDLITSMFTINELFAESKAKTVQLLQSFSQCKKGALFLFVESAGSYSEITIGAKKFPVHFLIHHTLTSGGTWELVSGEDSRWYRLEKNLQYPLKLENMRFFYRLYKRL